MKTSILLIILLFITLGGVAVAQVKGVKTKIQEFVFLDSLNLTKPQVEDAILYLDQKAHTKTINSKKESVIFTLGDAGHILVFTNQRAKAISLAVIERWLKD